MTKPMRYRPIQSKTEIVAFRATPAERAEFEASAASQSQRLSEWLRLAAQIHRNRIEEQEMEGVSRGAVERMRKAGA